MKRIVKKWWKLVKEKLLTGEVHQEHKDNSHAPDQMTAANISSMGGSGWGDIGGGDYGGGM